MLKRILALLAVMTLLCASAALAEDLSSLTDRELMKLYLDVVDEMRNRTAAEQENAFHEIKVPHDVEFEADIQYFAGNRHNAGSDTVHTGQLQTGFSTEGTQWRADGNRH